MINAFPILLVIRNQIKQGSAYPYAWPVETHTAHSGSMSQQGSHPLEKCCRFICISLILQRNLWILSNRLMWKTTPITLSFLIIMIPWLDPPGALSFNWNFKNTSAILLSAFLGFLLQWSGALALGYVV